MVTGAGLLRTSLAFSYECLCPLASFSRPTSRLSVFDVENRVENTSR